MIQPGSLVGFALVFVVTTWLTSALLCGGLLLGARRLRRLGPRAERRAASIALALPVVLGGLIAAGLAGLSLAGPGLGVPDHCLDHPHHLHLCMRHGDAWLIVPWVVALTSGVAAVLLVRIARAAHAALAASRRLRAVRAVSSARRLADGTEVICAPSRRPFCFTAGLRAPRIYIGTATLDQLDDDQQRAMLAHERAHVAFGDLWRGTALSLVALLGAPGLAAAALRRWHEAGERLCDRVAARRESPAAVASAILALARQHELALGRAFVPHPDQLATRVEAVLDGGPLGIRTARRFAAAAGAALVATALASALLADPLHHAIETLLGSL